MTLLGLLSHGPYSVGWYSRLAVRACASQKMQCQSQHNNAGLGGLDLLR